jgi:hypothetical protein
MRKVRGAIHQQKICRERNHKLDGSSFATVQSL